MPCLAQDEQESDWDSLVLRHGSPCRMRDSVDVLSDRYQGQRFSLSAGAMENGSDPPGTRRSASGRLINASTGRFMADPNKEKKAGSTRRTSGRSASASTPQRDRSRSPGDLVDSENQHQDRSVQHSTFPDSAVVDVNRKRLPRKTSVLRRPSVVENEEYERVQAELRQGIPQEVKALTIQAIMNGNGVPGNDPGITSKRRFCCLTRRGDLRKFFFRNHHFLLGVITC
eukprot:4135756-Amphidinium_carterae.1